MILFLTDYFLGLNLNVCWLLLVLWGRMCIHSLWNFINYLCIIELLFIFIFINCLCLRNTHLFNYFRFIIDIVLNLCILVILNRLFFCHRYGGCCHAIELWIILKIKMIIFDNAVLIEVRWLKVIFILIMSYGFITLRM